MVIIKNFKIALVVGSIMTMAFVVSSCAKPIDELVQIDETKKIVKKTTNINRDEDGNIVGSKVKTSDSQGEEGENSSDRQGLNSTNPIEESLNESFSKKFSEWEETYEKGEIEDEGLKASPNDSVEEGVSDGSTLNSHENAEKSETKAFGKGAVSLRVNKPKIDKSFGTTTAPGGWKYGITPIIWKYVAPNTKLISNTKPGSSETFGNKVCATSGESGCFIPCFSKNVPEGTNWTGALCCFEELKEDPYNYTYEKGLMEVTYKDIPIAELLSKNADVTEVTIGLYTLNGEYINIIYCDELDEIINNYY